MLDEQTNAWRELADEEIERVAGGTPSSAPIHGLIVAGLDEIGLGVKERFTGRISEASELIREGGGLIAEGFSELVNRP